MKGRILALGAVATSVAAALLFGGVLSPEDTATTATATAAARPSPTAATETLVRDLQGAVRRAPRDAEPLASLGRGYLQRYRETFDPSYLDRAARALQRARRLEPRHPGALEGLGALALARHDFRGALRLARLTLSVKPGSATALGVSADALVELGRYGDAFRAFDRMAAVDPGVSSYARVAYGRELIGRPRAAGAAMTFAVDAAAGQPEAGAWARVERGKLLFGIGDLRGAVRQYRFALAIFPGYVYALDALALAEAGRGRLDRAIALSRRTVDRVPLPQFVATLGTLYRAAGRERLARRQDALINVMTRLLRASGVRGDLELAQYRIDQGIDLPGGLALARRGYRDRPGIEGDDVLGWALTRNGRCAEGVRYAKRSLRLGTRNAVKYFHRGMAERCAGNPGAARTWFRRALELNPAFSPLWAPVARRYAR